MRLLKRGAYMYACIYILSVQERNVDLDPHVATIFSIVPVHQAILSLFQQCLTVEQFAPDFLIH